MCTQSVYVHMYVQHLYILHNYFCVCMNSMYSTYMYILFNHTSSKRVIVVKLRIQVTYLPNGLLHVCTTYAIAAYNMLYIMYSVRSFACSVVEWNPLIRTP